MKSYKLKLTALTPIHIGTGEVYEPTSFVIDDGYLYEFDEVLFFQNLSALKKTEFIKYVEMSTKEGYELFEKIHQFIISNKSKAKEVAFNKVKVSHALEAHYSKSIAKKVQVEKKYNNKVTKSVFNNFNIQRTQRLGNRVTTYLSGSSIKGAISTAYQEYIYQEQGKDSHYKLFNSKEDKLFRNLSVSDTLVQKAEARIAYAINQERFEDDSSEISTMIEVNTKESQFLLTMTLKSLLNDNREVIDESITKEKIINACNRHYNSIYEEKESKKISLKENQFIMSVGRHSGARAVTIDGIRTILVKLAQIQNKRDEDDDASIRIDRLHKKSHFESSKISELFADEKFFNTLTNKEKQNWKQGIHFIENPSELEDLIQNRRRVTINAYLKEETTVWMFSENKSKAENSFGWVLCEFIEDDEYQKLFKEFKAFEDALIDKKNNRQQSAIEKIKKSKEDSIRNKERMRKDLEDEVKKEVDKKAKRERELASMTPLEKKIDELQQKEPNTPKSTLIFQSIKNGLFNDEKLEVLKVLKKIMVDEGKWKEKSTAKKPEKDKVYKRTLEVIKMMKELK